MALRQHKDATASKLKALWLREVPRVMQATDDVALQRELIFSTFGPPPYPFLDLQRNAVPSVLWSRQPFVPIVSAEYAIMHPGPNAFSLRTDFVGATQSDLFHFEYQLGTGSFAERILAAQRRTQPEREHVRLLWAKIVRERSNIQVRLPIPGTTLALLDVRNKTGEQTGTETDTYPERYVHVIRRFTAPDKTQRTWLVVSFEEAPELEE